MGYKEIVNGSYVRFSSTHRWIHNTLAISFVMLSYTGFALRYSEAWWALPFLKIPAGPDIRGWLHRFFGVALAMNFVIQVVLLFGTTEGKQELRALWLSRRDFREMLENLAHWFGILPTKPRAARYSYVEKVEYWALVWGTLVMMATGFFMWSETWALRHFPGWVYDVFRLIHFYEAVLATLAIAVWHFYWVIFDPEVYPYSEAMFTGKVSLEYLQSHHPLEYEDAVARQAERMGPAQEVAPPETFIPETQVARNPGEGAREESDDGGAKGN